MNTPKLYALLNTTTLAVETFDAIEAMRKARAGHALRKQPCVSFLWQDGNYWIDGMTERQVGKVIAALNHPEGLVRAPFDIIDGGKT